MSRCALTWTPEIDPDATGVRVDEHHNRALAQLLGRAGMDVEYALSLFLLSKKYETRGSLGGERVRLSEESIPIQLSIRYHHDTLDDLTLFAFYISHRCLGLTKSALDISDAEFNASYDQWHRDLANS